MDIFYLKREQDTFKPRRGYCRLFYLNGCSSALKWCLTKSSRWGTWEILMPSVVQKKPGSQGCYPQGSNKCQAEVFRSHFLFPGGPDHQPLYSLCKTVPFSWRFWWPLSRNGKVYPEWRIWMYVTISGKWASQSPCRGAVYHHLNLLTLAVFTWDETACQCGDFPFESPES